MNGDRRGPQSRILSYRLLILRTPGLVRDIRRCGANGARGWPEHAASRASALAEDVAAPSDVYLWFITDDAPDCPSRDGEAGANG